MFSSFVVLDSGFRRNDNKEPCAFPFVTPAKAGVQFQLSKRGTTLLDVKSLGNRESQPKY